MGAWETDLGQTEISFKPDLWQSFGSNSDSKYTGKYCSVSSWDTQKDSPLGTVAPCRFGSALRVLSWHTLQNTTFFHKHRDAVLFPGGMLLSPSHTQSFPRSWSTPLITKPIFLPKSAHRNFLFRTLQAGSNGPLTGTPPQYIKDSEPAAILATVQMAAEPLVSALNWTSAGSHHLFPDPHHLTPQTGNILYWEPVATELFHCVYVIVAEKTQVYVCKCSRGHLLCHSRLQEKKAH